MRAQLAAARAEAEAAIAAKEKEAQGWKAKWKASASSSTEATERLGAAEKRLLAEASSHTMIEPPSFHPFRALPSDCPCPIIVWQAASHAAVLAARDGKMRELEEQLESGATL